MPQKEYYLPKTDAERLSFIENFDDKLSTYAATFGIAAGTLTSVTDDRLMFKYILDMQEKFKTFKQDITAYKNLLSEGPGGGNAGPVPIIPTLAAPPTLIRRAIFRRIRELVTQIKANSAYTENIGEDLGIVGDEQTVEINKLQPELKSEIVAGHPVIKWTKGHADALDIFVDRNDGAGFVFLATDTSPDYTDTTPLPQGVESAVWEYQAIYKINDDQVGKYSESIKVTVSKKAGN